MEETAWSTSGNGDNSILVEPVTSPSDSMGDGKTPRQCDLLQRSMIEVLNKRGYNVRDSANYSPTADTSLSSISSTSSRLSSVLLGLKEPSHGQGPLHLAVRKGDAHILDAILTNGGCCSEVLDAPDDNGNTALHFAAGGWRSPNAISMVEKLLEAGANVQVVNKRGLTPIAAYMLTVKIDQPVIAIQLLEHGAIAETDVDGSSLLQVACQRQLPMIAGVLVAYGASMATLDKTSGLMCYEVASAAVKHSMLRNIRTPPPYIPLGCRHHCMRCKVVLQSPKRAIRGALKRMVGMKNEISGSCYHCGLIFCRNCLQRTQSPEVVKSRQPGEDLAMVQNCRLCEAVLKELRQKYQAEYAMKMHRKGFGATY